jgi:hypothetical protein
LAESRQKRKIQALGPKHSSAHMYIDKKRDNTSSGQKGSFDILRDWFESSEHKSDRIGQRDEEPVSKVGGAKN